jgi:hypothetical protein
VRRPYRPKDEVRAGYLFVENKTNTYVALFLILYRCIYFFLWTVVTTYTPYLLVVKRVGCATEG